MAKIDLSELTGPMFLNYVRDLEEECKTLSLSQINRMGEKLPQCYEVLGMTLALIDSSASCHWGCHTPDHKLEYLIGRAANSGYSALNLALNGYYDQSLSIARTIGEIANLLSLFQLDNGSIEAWKAATERTRKTQFSPFKVRMRIEELDGVIPVDQHRYGQLSLYSIHASPDALPQAHNKHGQPITFPKFQPAGLITCLNEISLPIAFTTLFTGILLDYPDTPKQTFMEISRALIKSIGGIQVTVKGRPWFKLN